MQDMRRRRCAIFERAQTWIAGTIAVEPLEGRLLLSLLGQQLFPADHPWNQRITDAPVAASSPAIMNNIITRYGDGRLHPDFGQDTQSANDLYGFPYNIVHGNMTPKVNVIIDDYPDESDVIAVPIPDNPVLENDYQNGPREGLDERRDSHLIIWDQDNNIAYELYRASRPNENTDGLWHAGCETVWDMNTNAFRTLGWTSADAAGLSILAGLARPDEGLPTSQGGLGVINHAIRVTLQNAVILNQFIYPASHTANPGNNNPAIQPPMGARFRLRSNVDISHLYPQSRIIAQAMKDYGLIVADNGSNFFFSGASSSVDADNHITLTWDDDDIQDTAHGLKSLRFSNFEVVDLTPVVTGLSQRSALPGMPIMITGKNFSGAAGQLHVLFGTVTATSVTIVDDAHVLATVPQCGGTVDVRVQSGASVPYYYKNVKGTIFGYGMSNVTSTGRFFVGADNTPPAVATVSINDGLVQRSMVNKLTVAFSEDVILSDGALSILTTRGTAVPDVDVSLSNVGKDLRSWELTFSGQAATGGSLPDGMYILSIAANGVSDLAGSPLPSPYRQRFHRLFGDTDGDRDVDQRDLALFRQTLNRPAACVWWLDYNGDTRINNADYLQMRQRLAKPLLR